MMTMERLQSLLGLIPGTRVGVLGDFCLDAYWIIDPSAEEISVETGKPTRPIREQRYSPGGAGNVAANLRALGVGTVHCFGVVGDDPFGEAMLRIFRRLGIGAGDMRVCPDPGAWQTPTYCKPYIGDEELSRIDVGNFNRLPDADAGGLIQALEAALPSLDVVIVNQQLAAGIHTPGLQTALRDLMRRHPTAVFIADCRQVAEAYPGAWHKMNAVEACCRAGNPKTPVDPVTPMEWKQAGRTLAKASGLPVILTCGDSGCVVCDESGESAVPGVPCPGPVDPVGAGDAFLSALAATVAAGGSRIEAAEMANIAARVTVAKLRCTGTASPAEILAVAADAAGRR